MAIPVERIAGDPTPDEAAETAELLELTLRGLTDKQREILQLSLQGFSPDEISKQVNRSLRTVRRAIDTVKKKLRERLGT